VSPNLEGKRSGRLRLTSPVHVAGSDEWILSGGIHPSPSRLWELITRTQVAIASRGRVTPNTAKKNPGAQPNAGAVTRTRVTRHGGQSGTTPWAQAHPGNRQITAGLPRHYGPKTDRRTATAPMMSHNVRRARCDYCQLNAIGAPLTSIWWVAPHLGLKPRHQIKSGRGNQ
jgi:hypothetical protein